MLDVERRFYAIAQAQAYSRQVAERRQMKTAFMLAGAILIAAILIIII